MKKTMLALLIAISLCGLCGCGGSNSDDSSEDPVNMGSIDMSVYENKDGNIVYHYNLDGETPAEEYSEDTVKHREDDKKIESVTGGISLEEAEKILNGCSNERLYIPCKISELKKRFNDIVQFNDKDHYSVSLYYEKNSIRMYVGCDLLISCDGKEVYKQDATGSYQELELNSADKDKTTSEMYPNAKLSPEDALFTLNNFDRKILGLTEAMKDHTFEITDELITKNSIECYQITPKLICTRSVKYCSSIYVAADGSNRVLVINKDKSDYELAE